MLVILSKNDRGVPGVYLEVDGHSFTRNHTYEKYILWRCRSYLRSKCLVRIRTTNIKGPIEDNVILDVLGDSHNHEQLSIKQTSEDVPIQNQDSGFSYKPRRLQENSKKRKRLNYDITSENDMDSSVNPDSFDNKKGVTCLTCGLTGPKNDSFQKLSGNSATKVKYIKTFCELLSLPLESFGNEVIKFNFCTPCRLKMRDALTLNIQIAKLKEQVDLIKCQIEASIQNCQYELSSIASDTFNPNNLQTPEFQFRDKILKKSLTNVKFQNVSEIPPSEFMTQEWEGNFDENDTQIQPSHSEPNNSEFPEIKLEVPDQQDDDWEGEESELQNDQSDHFPSALEEQENLKEDNDKSKSSMELRTKIKRPFNRSNERESPIGRRFDFKNKASINDALSRSVSINLTRVETLSSEELDLIMNPPPKVLSSKMRKIRFRSKNGQRLGFKCDHCGRILASKDGLKEHQHQHFNTAPHKCPFPGCTRTFTYQVRIKDHLALHYDQKTHPCPTCDKKFKTIRCVNAHSKFVHGIVLNNYQAREKPSDDFSANSPNVKTIKPKPKRKKRGPFVCETCGKIYKNYRNHIEHIMTHHDGPSRYNCEEEGCTKKFYSLYLYQEHLSRHKGEKNYLCEFCSKTFHTVANLNGHVAYVHQNKSPQKAEDPTICEICQKVLKNKFAYRKHVLDAHKREKKHKCEHPGCTFLSVHKYQVARHAIIHSEKKSFECKVPGCGKAFKFRASLTKHGRLHTGERPYVCQVCKKGFTNSYNLRVHEAVHSSETPFKCEKCGKDFPVWHYLYLHLRKHKKDEEGSPSTKSIRIKPRTAKKRITNSVRSEEPNVDEGTETPKQDSHQRNTVLTIPINNDSTTSFVNDEIYHPNIQLVHNNYIPNMPFCSTLFQSQIINSSNPVDFSQYSLGNSHLRN